ncbi:hypothetical protein GCM10010309_78960 [Streptomyces violaceochromogenes]|nr:hypothetical protein GCM10010309_78960 [Streptomyces violaceochromogenes]
MSDEWAVVKDLLPVPGWLPYLDDRWNEGFTNAWRLWEEIVPLCHKGSYQPVRAYLHMKRTSPRPVTARPPSLRTVSGWILRRPATLTEPEQLQLKAVRTTVPNSTRSPDRPVLCGRAHPAPGRASPSR